MTQALREAIAARRALVVEEMAALEGEIRLCDRFLAELAVASGFAAEHIDRTSSVADLAMIVARANPAAVAAVIEAAGNAATLAKPKRKWTRRKAPR